MNSVYMYSVCIYMYIYLLLLFPSLSLSLSFSVSVSVSLSPSLFLSVSVSLCLSVCLSLCLSLSLSQIAEFEVSIQSLETERDFYFGKLRDIEVICQENEGAGPIVEQLLAIMYATQVRNHHTSWCLRVHTHTCIEQMSRPATDSSHVPGVKVATTTWYIKYQCL